MNNKGTLYPQLHEQLCDYGFVYSRHYTDVVGENNNITTVCTHTYRHCVNAVTLHFYSDADDICVYVTDATECEEDVKRTNLHTVTGVLTYAQQFQIN